MVQQFADQNGEIVIFDREAPEVSDTISEKLESELVDSFGDGEETSEVILYKQETKSHKDGMHIVEKWSGDIVTLARIQETARDYCNPGKDTYFRIIIRKKGKIVQHKPFSIAGKSAQSASVPVAVKGNNEVSNVLNAMLAMQERQNAALAELMKPKDQIAEMKSMLSMITAIREVIVPAQTQASTLPDFGGMIGKAMETMNALFEMQSNMLDMRRELQVEEAPGNELLSVVKELGPKLLETLQGSQAVEAMKANAMLANSQKTAQSIVQPQPRKQVDDLVAKAIGEAIEPLINAGADVEEVARGLVEKLPKEQITTFLAEKPLARLLMAHEPLQRHVDWLADLVAVLDELTGNGVQPTIPNHESDLPA